MTSDPLELALAIAHDDLAGLDSERERLAQQQRELDAKEDDLRAEIRGLELALKRQQPSRHAPLDDRTRWQSMTRIAAVVEILREEGNLSPSGISAALETRGRRGDHPKLVSAALNDLLNRGRVQHAPARTWIATPRPQDLRLPGDAGGVTS